MRDCSDNGDVIIFFSLAVTKIFELSRYEMT